MKTTVKFTCDCSYSQTFAYPFPFIKHMTVLQALRKAKKDLQLNMKLCAFGRKEHATVWWKKVYIIDIVTTTCGRWGLFEQWAPPNKRIIQNILHRILFKIGFCIRRKPCYFYVFV